MKAVDLFKIFAVLAALVGCAEAPQNSPDQPNHVEADPLSPVNHAVFQFNRGFDIAVLRPVTVGYRAVMPEDGRHMVSNALDNLYSPVSFANSIMQADAQNSFAVFWRFFLNSTFGVAGLFDFASQVGLHARTTDFGQTLAIYGVNSGPYVVLPFFGPSNVRDAFGRLTDAFLTPTNYASNTVTYSVWGATAIDMRSRNMSLLDSIYKDSLDPYVTLQSLYQQKRAADIRKAKAARKKALEKSMCNQ